MVGVVCAVLLALPSQEDPKVQGSIELPPIVVTPSRTPEKARESGRSASRVTAERRLELQARGMGEAIAESTGVFLQRTNRGAGAPIIRGLIGPQNLLVVDGVRFNTSTFRTGPNQYLLLLDPNVLDQVEIVRGPSSVLYGNGAIGGVVQVLTLDPTPSGGAFEYDAKVAGRFGSEDLGGGGTLQLSAGAGDLAFFLGASYDHFGTLRAGGGFEQPLSDYDAAYWQAKLLWSSDPSWTLSMSYLGSLIRDAGRADKLGLGEVRQYDNDDHLFALQFRWAGVGVLRGVRAILSFHRLDEEVDRFNCQKGADGTVLDKDRCASLEEAVFEKKRNNLDGVDVVGADVEVQLAFMEDRIRVTTGLEVYQDYVSSSRQDAKASDDFVFVDKDRGNFSDGSTYLSLGVYAHTAMTILDVTPHHLQIRVSGGVRFSYFDALAPDVPDLGDVDYQFDGFVGSGGIQLLLPEWFVLFGSFTQGFRAPNLQETTVLGNTGSKFEIPNPDLKPERSDTFEVGARAWLGPVDISAVWFYSLLDDALDEEAATHNGESEVDGTPVVRRVNAASGVSTGVEGELGVTFWRLRLSAGVAWMTSELTNAAGDTHPARRIPPVFGQVALRYTQPGGRAFAEIGARWAGPQTELHPSDKKDLRICETSSHSGVLDPECDGSDGWVTLDLRGGWQFIENLRADLSVTNLLDVRYKAHGSGFDAPGVGARATLTATF